ncbi:MAG: hypothetical protein ACRC4P_10850, partial [Aeromonas sp.]
GGGLEGQVHEAVEDLGTEAGTATQESKTEPAEQRAEAERRARAEPAEQEARAEQKARVEPAEQEAMAEQEAKAEPAEQEARAEPAEQEARAEPADQTARAGPTDKTAREEPTEQGAKAEPAEQEDLEHRVKTDTHTERETARNPNSRLRWAEPTGCREPQGPDWDRTKQEPSRTEPAKETGLENKTRTDTQREKKSSEPELRASVG